MQAENSSIRKEQVNQFLNDVSNSFMRFSSEVSKKATSLNRNEYSRMAKGNVEDGVRKFLDRLSSAFAKVESNTKSHPEPDSVGVTTYVEVKSIIASIEEEVQIVTNFFDRWIEKPLQEILKLKH
jgi:cell division septum initiation protein DivIVA